MEVSDEVCRAERTVTSLCHHYITFLRCQVRMDGSFRRAVGQHSASCDRREGLVPSRNRPVVLIGERDAYVHDLHASNAGLVPAGLRAREQWLGLTTDGSEDRGLKIHDQQSRSGWVDYLFRQGLVSLGVSLEGTNNELGEVDDE
jgi:hypothetical protein